VHERGSVLPFVALIVVATGGLVLGLGRVGADAVARTRASTAADAAALAGAAEGREAAEQLAAANGGRLVDWIADGTEVEVTVRVGAAEAVARARRLSGTAVAATAGSRRSIGGNEGACLPATAVRGGCAAPAIPYTSTRGVRAATDEHDGSGSGQPPAPTRLRLPGGARPGGPGP
jgi:hypothetical protein